MVNALSILLVVSLVIIEMMRIKKQRLLRELIAAKSELLEEKKQTTDLLRIKEQQRRELIDLNNQLDQHIENTHQEAFEIYKKQNTKGLLIQKHHIASYKIIDDDITIILNRHHNINTDQILKITNWLISK